MKKSKLSSKYAVFVALILLVGWICSILLGIAFPSASYNEYTEQFDTSYNWGIMLIGIISSFILSMLFAGIYDILKYLEELGAGKDYK